MSYDRTVLYTSHLFFFDPVGNSGMELSYSAAHSVCLESASRRIVVVKIEGGIHHPSGSYEPDVTCIWNGIDPPISQKVAHQNNLEAIKFLEHYKELKNAFLITASAIEGYLHNIKQL